MTKIVTISREFGSGGRTVGKKAAEILGVPCYDSEIISEIAKQSGFAENYIREHSEDAVDSGIFAALSRTDYYGLNNSDQIWTIQCNIIKELAEKGPCVIVGRCADYILNDRHDLLKVFIHAPKQARMERIVREYGETEVDPAKRISDKDKRRITYYQLYTDNKWGVAQNYNISLDTEAIGIDRCAEIIASLAKD